MRNKYNFINKIAPLAQTDMQETGILASLTIAQGILESGWGKSELALKANNIFGIKGDYNGKSHNITTKEFVGGKWIEIYADFRKYPSLIQCISDHSNKFLTMHRYRDVRNETDYKQACIAVYQAGYATAPTYADTLIKIIERYKLYKYDTAGGNKMKKIFLGVGHGGADSGAVGLNGIKESDINLGIAKACRDELERHGVQVLMSRTKDENDDLREEIAECNAYKPTLAVDIHNNAGGGDGFEAFYSVQNTTKGKISKLLAMDIESEVTKIGQNSRGLKTKLITSGSLKGQDWFGFVREPHCPSILVECAFVDTKDVQIVDTLAEQKIMGVAVAKGILKNLGIAWIVPQSKKQFYLWVGHFGTRKNAENASKKITELGYYNAIKETE